MIMDKKPEIIDLFIQTGLLPLFYHSDIEICKNVIKSSKEGGSKLFEFTNRGPNALEIFRELVIFSANEASGLTLGVGTIKSPVEAQEFINAGAEFVVSPFMDPETGKVCLENQVPWIPGCATPTEIFHAQQAGADIIKVFPAEQLGGPGFIKSILATSPALKLMPSGGVSANPENINNWFEAGACCISIGSKLFDEKIFEQGKFNLISDQIRNILEWIQEAKSGQ